MTNALEERLSAARDTPLAQHALIVAEGQRDIGRIETALQISEVIPRIITLSDAASAALLRRALISRARSLDALGRHGEASSAFATAAHVCVLAGRTHGFS